MNGFKIVSATSFQDYLTQIARKRCQLQDMWMSCFDSQDGICQFLHRIDHVWKIVVDIGNRPVTHGSLKSKLRKNVRVAS